MCAVLAEHGIKISPSTYYEWIAKKPTRQQLRDEQVEDGDGRPSRWNTLRALRVLRWADEGSREDRGLHV